MNSRRLSNRTFHSYSLLPSLSLFLLPSSSLPSDPLLLPSSLSQLFIVPSLSSSSLPPLFLLTHFSFLSSSLFRVAYSSLFLLPSSCLPSDPFSFLPHFSQLLILPSLAALFLLPSSSFFLTHFSFIHSFPLRLTMTY